MAVKRLYKITHLHFRLVNLFKVRLSIVCVSLLFVGSSSTGERLDQDQRQCWGRERGDMPNE